MENVYLIDTCSLIDLKNGYPREKYPKLWESIENLIRQKRIIIIEEVAKEIKQRADELNKWIKNLNRFIRKPTRETISFHNEILDKHRRMLKDKPSHLNADPFLIAEALVIKHGSLFPPQVIIVTEESPNKDDSIPKVCQEYQIACTNLLGLFKMEGWKF
jgi:hypothetical protein